MECPNNLVFLDVFRVYLGYTFNTFEGVAMLSKVQKWGNSQGLRFTKTLLQEAQINVGDEVNVSVQEGRIIIEPVTKVRGKYDLKELVSKMPQEYHAEELDWGEPSGKEVW